MIQNPQEHIFPNFIERNFKAKEIAKKIYDDFVFQYLKKYPKIKPEKQNLENILHINTAVGKGGAAKVAYDFLCRNLNNKGYNSAVLAGANYGKPADNIEALKVSNIRLHKMLHRYSKKQGMLDFYNLESFNIPNLEIFKKANLIHLHNLHGAYFSPFVLPYLTSLKPVIWTLHDEQAYTGHCSYAFDCNKWQTGCGNCPDLDYYPKIKKDTTDFLLQTKKKIYDFSDFTVACTSHWLANRVKKSILGDKEIKVIYNGIDEKVFTSTAKLYARKMLNLPLNKKILLFSASGCIKNPQKGGKYILETYKRLNNNKDYLFVNLGAEEAKNKGNWIDVAYIQDEKELALYYSAADLFIYPSQAEVFGLVIAESMSCETPVIAFRNTAIPELVDHMETGYLAENKNIEDFLNGIKTFLDNDNLRKNASIKSRQVVLEKFTLDRMINKYIELYQEIFKKFN
ncbi:MAG TPA: glycosyltransferase [Candidatus Gastranaerophilales bacterium]|nr:glycosyltransferase [Candidatus Gastranaerophilales bacterium]